MLLIENGYLMDPASGREGYFDILTVKDRIVQIGEKLRDRLDSDTLGRCRTADAAGLIVAPGLVDVHVHFRDPGFTHKEDIYTGARAAARGGFTTVVLMANTRPSVDNEETLQMILDKGQETDIRVLTCANVTMGMKGKELVPMEKLAGCGAAGFTDDGVALMNESLVREAMKRAKELNRPVSFHEEDPAFIENNGVNRGKASGHYHIGGSPREAEYTLVRRDLGLALETGACINIQHISTKEAVELVRQAKAKGGDIHAEATPHHFTLTEDAVIQYGTLAKMNPPLREEADRQAVIQGLKDGTIDVIATDHAPHTDEEKAAPITAAPSGIIGLETALSLGITSLVDTGYLTMRELLEKMTVNPAAMYRLDAGYLKEGGPADMVLIDKETVETAGNYLSRSRNSPFTGWRLKGVVRATICKGKLIFENR